MVLARHHTKETLILLVIPESRSDIRDPVPLHFNQLRKSHWVPAFAGTTKIGINQSFPDAVDGDWRPGYSDRVSSEALPPAAVVLMVTVRSVAKRNR